MMKVVGCLCIYDERILLLRRERRRSYPGLWGSPGGKAKKEESSVRSALRELFEETGIGLSEHNLVDSKRYFVTGGALDFVYDLFIARFNGPQDVTLNPLEHSEAAWIPIQEALRLPLVPHHDGILLDQFSRFQRTNKQIDLFGFVGGQSDSTLIAIESEVRRTLGKANGSFSLRTERQWYAAIGAPASGKSSALDAMRKENPNLELLRERQILRTHSRLNRLLTHATDLQQQYAYFHFQCAVLPLRVWQLVSAPASDRVAIVDEGHYSALAYSKALYWLDLIDADQYAAFYTAYYVHSQILPVPKGVFFFDCPTHVLLQRIEDRAKRDQRRRHELQYSLEYLVNLRRAFADVARELAEVTSVIPIDTAGSLVHEIAKKYAPT